MATCAVATCYNNRRPRKPTEISYFRFPKDPVIRAKWVQRCCRQDPIDVANARICSDHFLHSDYDSSYLIKASLMPYVRPMLKDGAVPTRKLNGSCSSDVRTPKSKAASRPGAGGKSCVDDEQASSDQEREQRRIKNLEQRKERQERKDRKELVERLLAEHEQNPYSELFFSRLNKHAGRPKERSAKSRKSAAAHALSDGSVVQVVSESGAVVARAVIGDATPAGPAADVSDDDRPASVADDGAAGGASDSDGDAAGQPSAGTAGVRPKTSLNPGRSPSKTVKFIPLKTLARPLHLRSPRVQDLLLERTKEIMRLKLKVRRLEAHCLRLLRDSSKPTPDAGGETTVGEKEGEKSAHDGAKDDLPQPEATAATVGRDLQNEPLVILRNDRPPKLPSFMKHFGTNELSDLTNFAPANIHEAKELNHRLKMKFLNLQVAVLKWVMREKIHKDRTRIAMEQAAKDEHDHRMRRLLRLEAAVKTIFTSTQIRAIVRNYDPEADDGMKKVRRKVHWSEQDICRTLELRSISSDKVLQYVREKMKIPLPPMRTVKLRCNKSPELSVIYEEMMQTSETSQKLCSICKSQVNTIDKVIEDAEDDHPQFDEDLLERLLQDSSQVDRNSAGAPPKKRRRPMAAKSGAKTKRRAAAARQEPDSSDSDSDMSDDPGMWHLQRSGATWHPETAQLRPAPTAEPAQNPLSSSNKRSWRAMANRY